MNKTTKKVLTPKEAHELLEVLENRFLENPDRHKGLQWDHIKRKLRVQPEKLWSLQEMERTGGQPDVAAQDENNGEYLFFDCSPETPEGRRNLCYDHAAWESRKKNKPGGNARDMARDMGVELLNEDQYRQLQELGSFDTKTSSWLKTPGAIRELGGAIFGDRRYDQVFIYHNSAESYYGDRGFRGLLRV